LERGVLLGKGTGVLKGDLAWQDWVRNAFPLERGWLYLAVVGTRNNLCYFNGNGGRQNNNKKGFSNEFGIPFLYPDSFP
jgi:hypothetical protein